MRFLTVIFAFALCTLVGGTDVAKGSAPELVRVLPRGVQRGAICTLTFMGDRLDDAEEVFFYDEGFRVLNLKVINAKRVSVKVRVDADCRLGEHIVQLRTRSGVSDYRIMHVEAYPSVNETDDSNNVRENAQLIEPVAYSDQFPERTGVVVAGRITDEDHDWFAVDGRKGERLSIEVVGTRLGDFCDTVLELHGPEGNAITIVDDTPLTAQDPFVSIKLPDDGRYLIHLTDSAGRGSNSAWYRMHVGNFPRPTIASPADVKRDELTEIVFSGDCLGPIKQKLRINDVDLYQNAIQVTDHLGTTPTPVQLRLVDGLTETFSELEPNDNIRQIETDYAVPFSVAGRMDTPADRDFFKFNATKGQRIRVEAFGHRIGSAIDTTIRLRRDNYKTIVSDADSVGVDSLLTATIPNDGIYFVEIENALKSFGPTVRYKLDITHDQPRFKFGVQEFKRYSQLRQQVAVPAGNRFAMLVTAVREGFEGPFQLNSSQLPRSIQMFARPMPAGANTMPVVFEAEPFSSDSSEGRENDNSVDNEKRELTYGRLIDLTGESINESGDESSASVNGHFRNRAQLMRVQPNNMSLKDGVVDKLAVAVLEPVPFKVELDSPKVPISQSGRMNLRVNILREKGFKAPITLRLPFRPPGIGANPTVRVKPDQTFVNYPINANAKASVGVWPICLTAVSPNDLGSMVSTGLHDLEVVTPFVAIESDLISAAAGAEIVASCGVEVLRQFDGLGEVRLTALPDHVTSESQSIDADADTIEFPVVVGEQCVTGKNHSVNVEVTVFQDEHPIVFSAGRMIMRFSSSTNRRNRSGDRVMHTAPGEEQQ